MFSKEFLLLHTHMHIVFLVLHLNMLWFDIIKFYIKNSTVLTRLQNFVHGQWINYFSCSVCILKTWGDLKIVTEQYDIFYYLKKYCHMTPTAKRICMYQQGKYLNNFVLIFKTMQCFTRIFQNEIVFSLLLDLAWFGQ